MRRYFASLFMAGFIPLYAGAAAIGVPDVEDIEYPDDEPHVQAEIELGKKLFFDTRLSRNNQQSCATCHNPDLGFSDGQKTSLGTEQVFGPRNAPHLYNLAWSNVFMWDGRAASLEEQALGPIEAEVEMNLPVPEAVKRIADVPEYNELFSTIYGDEGVTAETLGKAIAAFERSIISMNSPFDKYMKGNKGAMSEEAVRGMALFEGKARCTDCHDGPNFTDESFHNIGVTGADPGRGKFDQTLQKAFKTPGLRNVLLTAPYMHDGSKGTLKEVVEFYNRGGDDRQGVSKLIVPLGLNEQEKSDLIAFMGALTDPVVVARPELP